MLHLSCKYTHSVGCYHCWTFLYLMDSCGFFSSCLVSELLPFHLSLLCSCPCPPPFHQVCLHTRLDNQWTWLIFLNDLGVANEISQLTGPPLLSLLTKVLSLDLMEVEASVRSWKSVRGNNFKSLKIGTAKHFKITYRFATANSGLSSCGEGGRRGET